MILNVILVVVMLAALVGMIVCNKQKSNPASQPIAMVLLLAVIACGGFFMYKMGIFGGNAGMDALRTNENKFYASQGFMAGQELKSLAAAGKTVIVVEPTTAETDERIVGLVDQYKAGVGNPAAEVVVEKLQVTMPAKPEEAPPFFEIMRAKDFDALFAKYPDAKVVISTIGLPSDAPKMKYWTAQKGPAFFLIGMPEMGGIGKLLTMGKLSGLISVGPKAKFNEDPAPENPAEAFAVRYVLINKNNVKEYAQIVGQ